jgi:hypothetical protein
MKYHFHGVYFRPQKAHNFTVGPQPHASWRLGIPQYCGTVLLSTKIASLKTTLYLNLVPKHRSDGGKVVMFSAFYPYHRKY